MLTRRTSKREVQGHRSNQDQKQRGANRRLIGTIVVMVGYFLLSDFDRWWERRQRRKELEKLWDDDVSGWER